jgi:hypothetical protein
LQLAPKPHDWQGDCQFDMPEACATRFVPRWAIQCARRAMNMATGSKSEMIWGCQHRQGGRASTAISDDQPYLR